MTILHYVEKHKIYALQSTTAQTRKVAKAAGFTLRNKKVLVTESPYIALNLIDYANERALARLLPHEDNIVLSHECWASANIPAPGGLSYRDYQRAGIAYASAFKSVLIADPMGLGKTIQALGLMNYLGLHRALITCPASLRYNWEREYRLWIIKQGGLQVVRKGGVKLSHSNSIIISYELAVKYRKQLQEMEFDVVICDESQFLKNPDAQRTKALLGWRGSKGLIDRADRHVFLSGTPIKNRADDLYALLQRVNPKLIDHKSYWEFVRRWCVAENTPYGTRITGTKNETDLSNRLRSGFMVRRSKEDALPELPPKQYNLVVFPANSKRVKAILKKEKQFDPEEIYAKGVPVGSAMPEIRHELGREMVKTAVAFVKQILDGGVEKFLLFGYHRDVLKMVFDGLTAQKVECVLIRGGDSHESRQNAVDRFQNGTVQGYVANMEAGGIGLNLTAATEVIMLESSWVFTDNEQAIDRAHRMGQKKSVNIHFLVMEGSIGAHILGKSIEKQLDASKITD